MATSKAEALYNRVIQTLDAESDNAKLEELNEVASKKQNQLTAGTGIEITTEGEGSSVTTTISCTLDTTVFKIVEELPTSDIDTNVIYVVYNEDSEEEENTFTEYIYVNGAWEKLGEFKADVDLSGYYTKEEVDETFATKNELKEAVDNLELELTGEETTIGDLKDRVDTIESDYITSESLEETLEDYVTNDSLSTTLESYETAEDAQTAHDELQASIDTKQDTLTAGTGIAIEDSVISCTLDTTVFKIVEELPTTDIDTNVIYVVANAESTEEGNTFTEYIYVNGAWEKLGEFKADVDLSDYATKEEVAAVEAKADQNTTDITNLTSQLSDNYDDLKARVDANETNIGLIVEILEKIIG